MASRDEIVDALHRAVLSIAGETELDKVLQQVVEAARHLLHSQYAALGVANAQGDIVTFVHIGMTAAQAHALPHLPRGRGLLGALIEEQRPIRLAHIASDRRSVGFPPHHPPMESFLGVPIEVDGISLGNLYATNKLGAAEFSKEDERLALMLATHAAVAIKNAHLYAELERLAVLEERTRLGMDLHDGVIQSIYAVGLTLDTARLALRRDPEKADQLLESATGGLNDAIRDLRNLILDLRPRWFEGDLEKGLRRLVREFQANALIEAEVTLPPNLNRLSLKTARAIFLTVQEALANVARHARAHHVRLAVAWQEGGIRVTLSDDGRGFEPEAKDQRIGHGLANMAARAQALGGKLQVISAPGEGTTVALTAPVTDAEEVD